MEERKELGHVGSWKGYMGPLTPSPILLPPSDLREGAWRLGGGAPWVTTEGDDDDDDDSDSSGCGALSFLSGVWQATSR